MTTVLFWDIDGTLLNSGGAGRFALEDAASEMADKSIDLFDVEMAGMTDRAIATKILYRIGIAPEITKIEQLWQLYQKSLPDRLRQTQGYVLSGVREILEMLHQRDDVISLLLTGNIEVGAWTKLAHYDLDRYFTGGAFGRDTEDRNAIASQALTVAIEKLGSVDLSKCYAIGDTPHDVRCGQAIGAKSIAIASGRYTVSDLIACNSWLVWQSFPKPIDFLAQIGLVGRDDG
jgi:phosphoglycolate phosphatase-like HAD superfamily hydrolase